MGEAKSCLTGCRFSKAIWSRSTDVHYGMENGWKGSLRKPLMIPKLIGMQGLRRVYCDLRYLLCGLLHMFYSTCFTWSKFILFM
ncbi:hypothetical protein BYT27DRAFT_6612178 [Phlegmacium glaucopus]|nr:hypothetical protein BYT27DRAFT_6612178 [Phlegmacium glaucopus]